MSLWQGRDDVALLAPSAGGPAITAGDVAACVEVLRCQGYATAFTTALNPSEQEAFRTVGFRLHERLHLLEHPLADVAPLALDGPRPRRHRRGELAELLLVDRAAFEPFWRFDERALREARRATPASRLRVVGDTACTGYAVFGRAQNRGYLQRLAVHPAASGHGLGTALVLDGLHWLRAHGAERAVVNTQESNGRAYALYQHLGFVPQPDGLAVLRHDLDQSASP